MVDEMHPIKNFIIILAFIHVGSQVLLFRSIKFIPDPSLSSILA